MSVFVHAVNSPGKDPLSCGRSHEHQQQPQASHLGSVSGAVSGGARVSGSGFSSRPPLSPDDRCTVPTQVHPHPPPPPFQPQLITTELLLWGGRTCWSGSTLSSRCSAADSAAFPWFSFMFWNTDSAAAFHSHRDHRDEGKVTMCHLS